MKNGDRRDGCSSGRFFFFKCTVAGSFGKRKKLRNFRSFCGAGYEIRTRDFHLGKVTLYQSVNPAFFEINI